MVFLWIFIWDDAENILENKTISELMFQWEICLSLCAIAGEQAMWAITIAWSMASQNVGREDSTAWGTRETEPVSVGRMWLLAHGKKMMVSLGLGREETPSSHREPRVQKWEQVSSILHALRPMLQATGGNGFFRMRPPGNHYLLILCHLSTLYSVWPFSRFLFKFTVKHSVKALVL